MNEHTPSVSVCLPVYNGESYIREAIESVLGQTFEDIELIICDNASTDKTAEICQGYVVRDHRVRYFRSDVNRGLAWNHNWAFRFVRGRFSMWLGHDDVLAKEYVGRCLETMEQDGELVLCFTNSNHIDGSGKLQRRLDLPNSGASNRPSTRFQCMLHQYPLDITIYGLMKTDALRQTSLHGGFAESDRVLLAEMALRGRFNLIPEHLFSRRFHASKASFQFSDNRERTLIFDPRKAGKIFSPELLKVIAFFLAVHRAKLSVKERFCCYRHLFQWLWLLRRIVIKDILIGLHPRLLDFLSRKQRAAGQFSQ